MTTRLLWATLFALLVSGNATAQKTFEEIVARVNNDIILKSELVDAERNLRNELAQRLQGPQLDQAVLENTKHLLRNLIDTALLLQQAKEMGLNADLEVIKNMEQLRQEHKFATLEALEKAIVDQGVPVEEFKQNIRTSYLRQQVVGREVYPKIIITQEEVHNFYDTNKQSFDKPAGVQVREILVATEGKSAAEIEELRKKADDALAAVKRGDDFAEVAQKYSDAPTAASGGDLGFFEKGQLSNQLEDALAKLQKGQVSEVLTMPYGFLILKVEDKHEGGILTFEIARTQIENTLWQQRVEGKIREYLTRLRMDGFVEVNEGYVDTGAAPASTAASESNPEKN
jgi:peptidyl-prolyl cis-trans isomerase SurA